MSLKEHNSSFMWPLFNRNTDSISNSHSIPTSLPKTTLTLRFSVKGHRFTLVVQYVLITGHNRSGHHRNRSGHLRTVHHKPEALPAGFVWSASDYAELGFTQ